MFLAQLGGGEWWSWIIWIVFMMVFFMFYPRMMVSQVMWKLEKVARELEGLSDNSKKFITKEISKKPGKVLKESIDRFFEFFIITPISLDPFGIVKKLDHVIQNERQRFRYFVKQVAPKMTEERRASMEMGLAGGITLHQIAKIVRHYVELIKKEKSYQIALIIQMQLPMVERMAKAMAKGTVALAKGKPIGDGLGPYVISKLAGNKKQREIADGISMATTSLEGRRAILLKARGPGGRIGRPGIAVEGILKKNRVARIITIDAAAKLEGEKTGSIAEGVGVAMGGPGVERTYIENIVVKKGIPLDSIIVKMSPEEAIMPMRKPIKDAYPRVLESIKRSLARTRKGERVLIVGVGNSSGVGNSQKDLKELEDWVNKHERKMLKQNKKRRY
jgi:hypothetical protein